MKTCSNNSIRDKSQCSTQKLKAIDKKLRRKCLDKQRLHITGEIGRKSKTQQIKQRLLEEKESLLRQIFIVEGELGSLYTDQFSFYADLMKQILLREDEKDARNQEVLNVQKSLQNMIL